MNDQEINGDYAALKFDIYTLTQTSLCGFSSTRPIQ